MADDSPKLRASKRKRAQVNYYEEPMSDDEVTDFPADEEQEEDEEELSKPKKRKVVSPKPLPMKKVFPFLSLPAEIRNEIYGYCLHDPAGVYFYSTTQKYRRTVTRGSEWNFRGYSMPQRPGAASNDDEDGGSRPEEPSQVIRPFVPALLAVCKQINTEARDVLYGQDFYVKDSLALHSFLVDLGPRAATYLKNLTMDEWGYGRGVHKAYNHACFTALASATNLQRFTFHGILSWSKAPKPGATMFYRDAFPWLEAVGAAKGKADAALDVINVQVSEDGDRWFYYGRRRHHWGRKPNYKAYDEIDGFRKELGKLLNDRMDRIRA